jgi:hypothetical protein
VSPSCRIPVMGERLKRVGTGAYGGPAQPLQKRPTRLTSKPGPVRRQYATRHRDWPS